MVKDSWIGCVIGEAEIITCNSRLNCRSSASIETMRSSTSWSELLVDLTLLGVPPLSPDLCLTVDPLWLLMASWSPWTRARLTMPMPGLGECSLTIPLPGVLHADPAVPGR